MTMRLLQGGIVLLIVFVSLMTRPAPQGAIEIVAGMATAILAAGYFLTFILEEPGPKAPDDR